MMRMLPFPEYMFLLAASILRARELDRSGSRLTLKACLDWISATEYVLLNNYAHEILLLCVSNLR